MELHEVKIGDLVSYKDKFKRTVKAKVVHRFEGDEKPHLAGHVNVQSVTGTLTYPKTIHVSKLTPCFEEGTPMDSSSIQEDISAMLADIRNSENILAAQKFNDILSAKVDEVIANAKIEVAKNMFNAEAFEEDFIDDAEEIEYLTQEEFDALSDEEKAEFEAIELDADQVDEALVGGQKKIDANKNGKLDAHDFKLLRAKKGMKEEVEQIDELSKKTLGSYVKKATSDGQVSSAEGGALTSTYFSKNRPAHLDTQRKSQFARAAKREKGINTAVDKLTKEEAEYVDEGNAANKAKKNSYEDSVGKKSLQKGIDRGYNYSEKTLSKPRGLARIARAASLKIEAYTDPYAAKKSAETKNAVAAAKKEFDDEIKSQPKRRGMLIGKTFMKMKKSAYRNVGEAYTDPYAAKKAAEMKKAHSSAIEDAKKEFKSAEGSKGKFGISKLKKTHEEVEQVTEKLKDTVKKVIRSSLHNIPKDAKTTSAKELIKLVKTNPENIVRKEEVEQIDELKKSTLGSYVRRASGDVAIQSSAATQLGRSGDYKGETKSLDRVSKRFRGINAATRKLAKEEVESVQEGHFDTKPSQGAKVEPAKGKSLRDKLSDPAFREKYKKDMNKMYGIKEPKNEETLHELTSAKKAEIAHELRHEEEPVRKTNKWGRTVGRKFTPLPDKAEPHAVHIGGKKWKSFPSNQHATAVANKLSSKGKKATVHKEHVEQIDEVITKKTPTGEVVSDFVHSKNPKFAGKSKKERIRMALGAKYGMMRNESTLDEAAKACKKCGEKLSSEKQMSSGYCCSDCMPKSSKE